MCAQPCYTMDFSLPSSSVHGISQAEILDWVAISSSRGSFQPRDWTHFSGSGRQFVATEQPGNLKNLEMVFKYVKTTYSPGTS